MDQMDPLDAFISGKTNFMTAQCHKVSESPEAFFLPINANGMEMRSAAMSQVLTKIFLLKQEACENTYCYVSDHQEKYEE